LNARFAARGDASDDMERTLVTKPKESQAEIATLLKNLRETYERLQVLTGGQVGPVFDPGSQAATVLEALKTSRESDDRFRSLFEAAATGIAVARPDGTFLQANAAYCQMLGYTEDELRSLTFVELTHPDDLTLNRALRAEMFAGTRESFLMEKRYLKKGGGVIWTRHSVSATRGPGGDITTLIVIAEDINEQKQAQDALRHSEERLRLITDLVPHGIFAKDSAGRHIFANPALAELAGLSVGEMLGKDDFDLVIDKAQAEAYRADDLAVIQSGCKKVILDEPRTDLSGRTRFLQTIKIPFAVPETGEPAILGVCMDITERKRIEARFRRLVDANVQGVFFWNTKGQTTGANDAFLRMVGYTREDLEAGRVSWADMTPPEFAEQDHRVLKELAATGVCDPFEKEFIRQDGSHVPVFMGPATFEDNRDEGFCFVLDLSERKRLEQQFLRVQRMESIGTLAGGLAHDLNNILQPILLCVDFLREESSWTERRENLEMIDICAQRGADIVRQVLSFARGLEGERIDLHPRFLLKELEHIIKDTFPKNIRLLFSVADDICSLSGDPTQMHQILLNLCVNARDAMPDGGSLLISAENRTLDEHYVGMNVEAKAGRYVCISVIDSGTGIPQKIIDRIFEPFFTTKELNKGTGLGLSTVLAIVKSHEGIVNVQSQPGKGTTFDVYLPATRHSLEAQQNQTRQVIMPRGNGETILVVDDEISILTITRQTLEAFGYRVLCAQDGIEAIAIYAEQRHEIAVVLTDMMMPAMDGTSLIRVLLRINPAVKIVRSSGLSSQFSGNGLPEAGVKHFLMKPYTAETLLTTMRAILDEV
jgi:PAS domain S-box-containing protein